MDKRNDDGNRIYPAGTQVLVRSPLPAAEGGPERPAGSVAVILRAPTDPMHGYRVRFPDGGEATLRHAQIAVRRHEQAGVLANTPDEGLEQYVIYRCIVGSRAFGLDTDTSDIDRRGIYLPPADRHWSLFGVPEQLEDDAAQTCYWELQKFLTLALKANPNVLECLYTPLVEQASPLAQELLAQRRVFLSRLVYQTFNGYVLSQFRRFEQARQTHGRLKWKHVMHLIRLLLAGITTLREGYVPVQVASHREELLAIRRGEVDWKEIDAWRLRLHGEFDAAYISSSLPDRPDYDAANRFLLRARRSMI